MKPHPKVGVLLLFAFTVAAAQSFGAHVALREAINTVMLAETPDSPNAALSENSELDHRHWIHTGPASRAHIDIGDGSVRLGANSSAEFDPAIGRIRFENGSLIYHNLRNQAWLIAKLGDADVILDGDAGFVYYSPGDKNSQASMSFGAMVGKTTVHVGAEKFYLKPADLLTISAKGQVHLTQFDLPKQIKSSLLLNGFKSPLPNWEAIQNEARHFTSLQNRGFVKGRSLTRTTATPEPSALELADSASDTQPKATITSAGRNSGGARALGITGAEGLTQPVASGISSEGIVASGDNSVFPSSSDFGGPRHHNGVHHQPAPPRLPGPGHLDDSHGDSHHPDPHHP